MPIKMTKIQNTIPNAVEDVEHRNSFIAQGLQYVMATFEDNLSFSCKMIHILTYYLAIVHCYIFDKRNINV